MNILIAHCGKGIYGGAELVIKELSNYLTTHGHNAIIVGTQLPYGFHNDIHPSVPCYKVDSYYRLRQSVQRLIGWTDVVNVHNFPATLTMFPIRTQTRSVVWMCNEPAEMFTNWKRKPIEAFNRWWVKSSRMEAVVADKFNADRFERIYKIKPDIVPYGVDYGFWSKGVPSRGSDTLRLLQVGTITPYKNQLASVFTLMGLLSKYVNATLTLVGEQSDRKYMERIIAFHNHKVNGRIRYMPHLPRNKVREYFYNHDILLHPIKGQGGWLIPFEAMCAGLPVVVTHGFSAVDMIAKNNLAVVSDNMIEAVERIADSGGVDTDNASAWVRNNLTWDKYGRGMVNAYKKSLGK